MHAPSRFGPPEWGTRSPLCGMRTLSAPRRSTSSWTTSRIWRRSDAGSQRSMRSEEHTSELQSQSNLVCRLLLEKKKHKQDHYRHYTQSTEHILQRMHNKTHDQDN